MLSHHHQLLNKYLLVHCHQKWGMTFHRKTSLKLIVLWYWRNRLVIANSPCMTKVHSWIEQRSAHDRTFHMLNNSTNTRALCQYLSIRLAWHAWSQARTHLKHWSCWNLHAYPISHQTWNTGTLSIPECNLFTWESRCLIKLSICCLTVHSSRPVLIIPGGIMMI